MLVSPATSVNGVVAPADPEMKSALVLISPEKASEPLRVKKLDLIEDIPFWVKPIEITFVDAPVFFTVKNLVTKSNFISLVSPNETFDEVTKGTAEIWYAGTYPSPRTGLFSDIYTLSVNKYHSKTECVNCVLKRIAWNLFDRLDHLLC